MTDRGSFFVFDAVVVGVAAAQPIRGQVAGDKPIRSYLSSRRFLEPDPMSIIHAQFTYLAAVPVRFVPKCAPFRCCPSFVS